MLQIMQKGQSCPALSKEQFPVKLYAILELADIRGCSGCSWLPHGCAFKIDDERVFMRAWVPKFFKQTKIRSFHRQLYLWGFKRLSTRWGANAWYNEFFVRGYPEEMKNMVRIRNKGEARRVSMETELVSAGPFPPREFQLKCNRTVSAEDFDLPLSEPARVSSPTTSSFIPTTAQMQALLNSNQGKQQPTMDSCQPPGAARKDPSSTAPSGIDEAKFRLTSQLEPLPFKDETILPAENEAWGRTKSTPGHSPTGDGSPLDEFYAYIDNNMIRPVDDSVPSDEFSAYINNMIRIL